MRTLALSDGNEIPLLGLGVWQFPDGPTTLNAARWAVELSYRDVDTAQMYGNEEGVGRGLRESGTTCAGPEWGGRVSWGSLQRIAAGVGRTPAQVL